MTECYSAEQSTKGPHQASVKLMKFVYFVASYVWEVFLLKAYVHYKVEWSLQLSVCRSLGQLNPNVRVMSGCYSLRQYFKASWCKSLSQKAFRGGRFCLRAWFMQEDSVIPSAEPCVPLQKAELAEPPEQLEQMSPSSAPWMDPAAARAALWLDNLKLWVKAPQAVGCNHLSHWLPHQNPNKGTIIQFWVYFWEKLCLLFC